MDEQQVKGSQQIVTSFKCKIKHLPSFRINQLFLLGQYTPNKQVCYNLFQVQDQTHFFLCKWVINTGTIHIKYTARWDMDELEVDCQGQYCFMAPTKRQLHKALLTNICFKFRIKDMSNKGSSHPKNFIAPVTLNYNTVRWFKGQQNNYVC